MYKGRRLLLANALAFLGISAFSKIADLYQSEDEWTCQVSIIFPPGTTMEQYVVERTKWMKTDTFFSSLEKFKATNVLSRVDTVRSSGSLITYFRFPHKEAHDLFVQTLVDSGSLNDSHLCDLGYKYSRQSYRS